jgi:hypothetical protein
MTTVQSSKTDGGRSTLDELPPEVVIRGPKVPKHLATIPEWTELGPGGITELWSSADESRLVAAVAGTTPAGRELIQKALWRRQKFSKMGQDAPADFCRSCLDQNELALLDVALAGNGAQGAFLSENLWRVDYHRLPPSMEEFITNVHYLGTMLHPDRPGGIWPVWLRILCDEFDRDSFLHNVVLTGALGTGKTTLMVVVLLYRICHLLLLKRPAEMYELGAGSALYFLIVSVTREAAQQTAFSQAARLMAASPFFQAASGVRMGHSSSGGDIELASLAHSDTHTSLHLISGSRSQHLIGRNIIGIGFDEGNYRLEKNQDAKAFELYGTMRNRVLSRLKTRVGYLAGITIIASSARDESSLTEQIRLEIEAAGNPCEQRVFQKAIYEVKPLPDFSLSRCFKVDCGLPNQEPTLLPGTWDPEGNLMDASLDNGSIPAPPDAKGDAHVVIVPAIYREAFERNCRQALQEICGISSGGSGRLFPTMADVDHCLEISKQEGVPRAWRQDEIPISSEDSKHIWEFLEHRSFLTKRSGQVTPLRHPERLRYAHIDLATQSFAGIAISHLVGQRSVDGLIRNGQPFSESRLIIEYDVILALTPGKIKPINFEKIQLLFVWLKERCGFNFGLVTADQFQSTMPLQMLEAKGIAVGRLSIDKDKTAYRQWRAAFEEHRIRLALHQRMYREAAQLIETDKRYDHPAHGSKDVTDAAAGAYLNAVNSEEAKNLQMINAPGLHWGEANTSAPDPNSPPITIPLKPYCLTKPPRQFIV